MSFILTTNFIHDIVINEKRMVNGHAVTILNQNYMNHEKSSARRHYVNIRRSLMVDEL